MNARTAAAGYRGCLLYPMGHSLIFSALYAASDVWLDWLLLLAVGGSRGSQRERAAEGTICCRQLRLEQLRSLPPLTTARLARTRLDCPAVCPPLRLPCLVSRSFSLRRCRLRPHSTRPRAPSPTQTASTRTGHRSSISSARTTLPSRQPPRAQSSSSSPSTSCAPSLRIFLPTEVTEERSSAAEWRRQ